MWWSDDVLPRWVVPLLMFLVASIAGVVSAFACFWLLLFVEAYAGRAVMFAAWFAHPDVVFAVAVSCGAAIGIATATGRSDAAMVRRGIAVAGVLLFLGVAAFVALQLWAGSSARAFVFD